MSESTQHDLEIIARVRDQASTGLRKIGSEGRRTGEELGAGFRKGGVGGETLKRGLREVTSAVVLLGGNAESTAGKIGGLFSNALGGLMHGGLLGAGIAAATGLFSLLTQGSREAEEQAQKEREKRAEAEAKAREDLAQRQKAQADYNAKLRDEIELLKARTDEERRSVENRHRLRDAQEAGGSEGRSNEESRQALEESRRREAAFDAEMKKADEARRKEIDDLREQARLRTDAAASARRSLTERLEITRLEAEGVKFASEVVRIRKLEEAGLTAIAAKERELLEYRQAMAAYEENQKATKAAVAKRDSANAEVDARLEMARAITEKEREQLRNRREYQRLVDEGVSPAKALLTIQAEATQKAAEHARVERDVTDVLRDQLAIAQATNEQERERIRRAQELRDLQARAGEEAVRLQQQLYDLADKTAQKQKEAAEAASKEPREMGTGEARKLRSKRLHESKQKNEAFRRKYDADGNVINGMGWTVPGESEPFFDYGPGGGTVVRKKKKSAVASVDDFGVDVAVSAGGTGPTKGPYNIPSPTPGPNQLFGPGGTPPAAPSPLPTPLTKPEAPSADLRGKLLEQIKSLEDAIKRDAEASGKAADATKAAAEAGTNAADAADQTAESAQKVADGQKEVATALGKTASSMDAVAATLAQMKADLKKLQDAIDKMEKVSSGG